MSTLQERDRQTDKQTTEVIIITVGLNARICVAYKPKTATPRYSKKLQLKTTTCDVSDYAYRTAAETDASLSDS